LINHTFDELIDSSQHREERNLGNAFTMATGLAGDEGESHQEMCSALNRNAPIAST